MTSIPHTLLVAAKAEARALCDAQKAAGTPIAYGHALESVAASRGYQSWRAYSAALGGLQKQVPPQPRPLNNRALLRIVAEYRMKRYDIGLSEVLDRLAADHPQVTFDRSKVEVIMLQPAHETIIAAKAVPFTKAAAREDAEFERYVRNPGFNPDEEQDIDLTGTPEKQERESLERELGQIEDRFNDSEEAGDRAGMALALEEHGKLMGQVVRAEFAEEFDDEGEVVD